jgi:hypothetical protein
MTLVINEDLINGPRKSDVIAEEILSVIPIERIVQKFASSNYILHGIVEPDDLKLSYVMASLETRGYSVTNLVFNPVQYAYLRVKRGYSQGHYGNFDSATRRDILMTDLYGHFITADVRVSNKVPKNTVFITGRFTQECKENLPPLNVKWGIYEQLPQKDNDAPQIFGVVDLSSFDPKDI